MITTDITIDFLKRLRTMPSWPQMAYAFDNRLVPVRTVIDYALEKVSEASIPNHDELSIAAASENDSIADFIHNLSEGDSNSIENDARLYWANILLAWAYEFTINTDDLLSTVEDIYADFDYPEGLASFVRYMPSEAPDLGSLESNQNRMICDIGKYVKQFFAD